MSEPLMTVGWMFIILTVPSFVFFLLGEFADEFWLMDHAIAFIILGLTLFAPALLALQGMTEILVANGYEFARLSITNCQTSDCGYGNVGVTFVAWISFGVLIYWLDYIAGASMHKLVIEDSNG